MKHVAVKSSQVKSVAYDPKTKKMHVTFSSGGTYSYEGVSPMDHMSMMTADSIGKHLALNIKGKFKHSRVEK